MFFLFLFLVAYQILKVTFLLSQTSFFFSTQYKEIPRWSVLLLVLLAGPPFINEGTSKIYPNRFLLLLFNSSNNLKSCFGLPLCNRFQKKKKKIEIKPDFNVFWNYITYLGAYREILALKSSPKDHKPNKETLKV